MSYIADDRVQHLQRDMFARSCIDGVMYKYNKCRSKHFRCND